MNRTKNITKLSLLVLAQVIAFILVYIATIAVGAALVYVAFRACVWGLPAFFNDIAPQIMRLGRLGILLVAAIAICIVGLWAFFVAVGIYLVKPLFIFPMRKNHHGREVNREEAPELFRLIAETAKAAGVKMPAHVYLRHDVNACVFFNTGFWNIFFPSRKNLVIGLGVFEGTSTEEVRSIIAHEFGHFAQSSMRVGSVLYITNKVISDLVYRRDQLDQLMLKWCLEDGIWGFWGKVTQSVVIRFREFIERMFLSQQRNYMRLSRQMEYDADAVACRITGSSTAISALCKIQKLTKSFDFYQRVVGSFINEKRFLNDYWKGYEITQRQLHLQEPGLPILLYDRLETSPDTEESKSRVNIEQLWDSHPSFKKRVEHARCLNVILPSTPTSAPAWSLIPPVLKSEISSDILAQVMEGHEGLTKIDWIEYEESLSQKLSSGMFPKDMATFFDRDLTNQESELVESPFSQENAAIVAEYEQAVKDDQLLKLLDLGKIKARRFLYDRIQYTVQNVPLQEHRAYTDTLRNKVECIDRTIRNEALRKSDSPELVETAYRAIFHAQAVTSILKEDFLPVRDEMIKELNEAKITDAGDYDVLRKWFLSYESAIKDVLKTLAYHKIAPFMSRDEHIYAIKYIDTRSAFAGGIDTKAINYMFAITDWIMRVHENLSHAAKMVIVNTLLERPLPDTHFLQVWNEEAHPETDDTGAAEDSDIDDGHEYVIIDSTQGRLRLPVPTDEEIDIIYRQEYFRYRLWEKSEEIRKSGDSSLIDAFTMPVRNDEGHISCVNPDDEEDFKIELYEYHVYMETHFQKPDWDSIVEAARKGHTRAVVTLAWKYLQQNMSAQAFECAMSGALAGEQDGMVILGLLKLRGDDRDPDTAIKLFKCAAHGGNDHALCNLAMAYATGTAVNQDDERALNLFERAAAQGNVQAQYHVGERCLHGIGCEADYNRGLFWLYKAANQGLEAAVNVIWRHHKAVGDTEKYMDVVRRGAHNGVEECIQELEIIRLSNIKLENPALNYDVAWRNPTPVFDINLPSDGCPVCGKHISPGTTVCPHCKEIIFEE